jgi:hypothetical protein
MDQSKSRGDAMQARLKLLVRYATPQLRDAAAMPAQQGKPAAPQLAASAQGQQH